VDFNFKNNSDRGPIWESSSDGSSWVKFDDYTQAIIEKAYLTNEKEINLTHGVFAKDAFQVLFSPKLCIKNNQSGTIRNLRRSGVETYRTHLKSSTLPKDSLSRSNPNYKAQRKQQRKASIVSYAIESFMVTGYSVCYSPEVLIIPPDAVTCSPERDYENRMRGVTSPRDRNLLLSPRKYEFDSEGSPSPLERSKSRKKFGFQFDRSEKHATSPELKPSSKSSFLPSSKFKYPFKQVSRLWGSQRMRQTNPKTPKKARDLRDFFEEELTNEQPVSRRKVRSRSVPNLETLMAMNDSDELRFMSPRPVQKSKYKPN